MGAGCRGVNVGYLPEKMAIAMAIVYRGKVPYYSTQYMYICVAMYWDELMYV